MTNDEKLTLAREALEKIAAKRPHTVLYHDYLAMQAEAAQALAAITTESAPAAPCNADKCALAERTNNVIGCATGQCADAAPAAGAASIELWAEPNMTARHIRTGGLYTVQGFAKCKINEVWQPVVIYRACDRDEVFARETEPFCRNFERVAETKIPAQTASIDTPEFRVALAVCTGHLDYYQDSEHEVVRQSRAALIAHINAWGAQQREEGRKALSVAHAELSNKYSALSAESVADGLAIVELRTTNTQLRQRVEVAEAQLAARPNIGLDAIWEAFREIPNIPDGLYAQMHHFLATQEKPAAHTTEATPVVSAQAPVVAAPVGDGDERTLATEFTRWKSLALMAQQAMKKQIAPEWECNSSHPALCKAIEAIDAALTQQKGGAA